MTTLEGKVAFITGASRGIGAAVGRALAERGVSLGLASRAGDDLGLADSHRCPHARPPNSLLLASDDETAKVMRMSRIA